MLFRKVLHRLRHGARIRRKALGEVLVQAALAGQLAERRHRQEPTAELAVAVVEVTGHGSDRCHDLG